MLWLSQSVILMLVGFSAPTPTASCTYTQVDTHYETTVTWSGFSATSLEVFNGSAPLVQSQFAHQMRSGNLTFSLNSAPTTAQVAGPKIGVRVPCNAAP